MRQSDTLFYSKPLEECGSALPERSIPASLVAGILAQEDWRFFEHRGIDGWELWSALKNNLGKQKILRGASTIDMQVAQICYLGERKKTLTGRIRQKLMQILIARRLNKVYPKASILRAYLAAAPLIPGGKPGFLAAAKDYFHSDLTRLRCSQEWDLILTLRNQELFNPRDWNKQPKYSSDFIQSVNRAVARQIDLLTRLQKASSNMPFIIIEPDHCPDGWR